MEVRFQQNLKKRPIIFFFILLGMILSLSACVVTPERRPHPHGRGSEPLDTPRPVDLHRIQGVWLIKAIGFPGKLEFYWTGHRWAGRINFDPHRPWDELTDIFFDPQTGEIEFARPYNQQWYTGTLMGNLLVGALMEGGRNYNWEARRH